MPDGEGGKTKSTTTLLTSSRNVSTSSERQTGAMAVTPSKMTKPRASSRLGGATTLLLVSILFHIVYLGSIFDIYFKSPVTKGIVERYTVQDAQGRPWPLAKRVVLIVGDGLRADKLFQTYDNPPFSNSESLPHPLIDKGHALVNSSDMTTKTTPAPFLRQLIQTGQARWGISHTRVPTESRPGHVALIGGMYEDVSAVTRGWTTNPVAFDSVFNQSSVTFSFGSPDILPMFKQGASDPARVQTWSYGEEFEDFSSDAVHLDLWCLDKLRMLLNDPSQLGVTNQFELKQQGVVFFLHLLGLDTTGHAYRPHGPEYHRNIRAVDQIVQQTTKLMKQFYNDDETAFVFTADHGMSSKGNHGDGEPDNTRTPMVAWGKGIGGDNVAANHDDYSKGWNLKGKRMDVEQADVAVLMSVLAGVSIPANSAGRIPLSYLDASPEFKARAAFANAQQILAEYQVKSDLKQARAISFRPFPELSGTTSVEQYKHRILELIQEGNFDLAQEISMELVSISLRGLRYFQTYDWFLLRSIVTIGYAGFVAYSTKFIIQRHVLKTVTTDSSPSKLVPVIALATFVALASRFYIEHAPPSYYLYTLFPCLFWSQVLKDTTSFQQLRRSRQFSMNGFLIGLPVASTVLQTMVAGYSSRQLFSILLFGMGILWPYVGLSYTFKRRNRAIVVMWMTSCLLLAIFPMLPVEKGESIPIILAGGASFLVLGQSSLKWLHLMNQNCRQKSTTLKRAMDHLNLELLLTGLCMAITAGSAHSLQQKKGLPIVNQVAGWAILVTSIVTPIVHGRPRHQPYMERLAVILFSFGPAFVILSLSYEALFLTTLCTTLMIWLELECALDQSRRPTTSQPQQRQSSIVPEYNNITFEHVRIALFFLAFLHISFFGVGNVASISSFYLEPVYRLIPIFAPFPMAGLLLFKLLTPFVILSSITTLLNRRLNLPPFALFVMSSTLSEYLTVNFFFLVTDKGSWLEIGSSITNFAICSLLGIFNTILYLGGEFVLGHTTMG
ncbi:Glycosyl phosphatidyl inositol anchor synthesis [Microbotryomycetes sp. JL221]|nr:Glycosyl phosphatidyl inositol anchor synthesis [Microbotryomycetes sp. JL221]